MRERRPGIHVTETLQKAGINVTAIALTMILSGGLPGQAPVYADKTRLLVWRDAAGTEHAVTSPDAWTKRRAHILANMQAVMGPLPSLKEKPALDVRIEEEIRFDKFTRRKLTYLSTPGNRVPAYL